MDEFVTEVEVSISVLEADLAKKDTEINLTAEEEEELSETLQAAEALIDRAKTLNTLVTGLNEANIGMLITE